MPITVNMKGKIKPNAQGLFSSYNPTGSSAINQSGNYSISGTIAHGSTVTITDALSRFGSRTNVKPLYVALGTQKAGLSLGRQTSDYFNANASASSAKTLGSITQAYRLDFKTEGGDFWGGDLFNLPDNTKPFIQYIERYYDFDITNSATWGSIGFNLKTNRLWGTSVGSLKDIYVGYQGNNGAGSCRIDCEDDTLTEVQWNGMDQIVSAWTSEELTFKNSSAINVQDGYYKVYRNNVYQNPTSNAFTTYTSSWPTPLSRVFLDQVSNGAGLGVSQLYAYIGYMCFDDEYPGAYLGNSSVRSSCAKLIRLPQKAWASSSISIYLVNSHLALIGNYLHIRTSDTTWLEAVQL